MPEINCPFPECEYKTDDIEAVLAAAQLNIHAITHNPASQMNNLNRQQPPKIDRPPISSGTTEEEWSTLSRKWTLFKHPTNTVDLFRDVSDISTLSEEALLLAIQRLAVITVAASVKRAELLALRQDHGQTVRSFAAKVKGKAQICATSKQCTRENCTQVIDYTEDIVKYVVISGIVDEKIKKDILSCADLDSRALNDTISLIENKEMAARAMTSNFSTSVTLAANSGYKQSKDLQAKLALKAKCRNCNTQIQKGRAGKQFSLCIECWKLSWKPEMV